MITKYTIEWVYRGKLICSKRSFRKKKKAVKAAQKLVRLMGGTYRIKKFSVRVCW